MALRKENSIALKALNSIPIPHEILEKNGGDVHGLKKLYKIFSPAFLGLAGFGTLSFIYSKYDTGEGDSSIKLLRSAVNIVTSLFQIPPTTSSNPGEILLYGAAAAVVVGSVGAAGLVYRNIANRKKIEDESHLEMARSGAVIHQDAKIGGEDEENTPQLTLNNHRIVVAEKTNPFIAELGERMLEDGRSSVLIGADHSPYDHTEAGKVLWPVWINTGKPDNSKVLKVANAENASELIIFTQKKDNLFLVDGNDADETGISVKQALQTIVEAYRQKPKTLKDTLSTLLFLPSRDNIRVPNTKNIDPMTYLTKHGVPDKEVTVSYIDELVCNSPEMKKNIKKGMKIAKVADTKYNSLLDSFIAKLECEVCENPQDADVVLVYSKDDNDVTFDARVAKDEHKKPTIAILDTEDELSKFDNKGDIIPVCIQTLVSQAIGDFETEQRINHPPIHVFEKKPNPILEAVLQPVMLNILTHGFFLEKKAALEMLKNMQNGEIERIYSMLPEIQVEVHKSGNELSDNTLLLFAWIISRFMDEEHRSTAEENIRTFKLKGSHCESLRMPKKKEQYTRGFHFWHGFNTVSNKAWISRAVKSREKYITAEEIAIDYYHTSTPTYEQLKEIQTLLEAEYQLGLIFKTKIKDINSRFKDSKTHTVYSRYKTISIKESLDILGI